MNVSRVKHNKIPHIRQQGYLMLLPIMLVVWQDVSVDFGTALSVVNGKSVMVFVVDWFTKFVQLGALGSNYSARQWPTMLGKYHIPARYDVQTKGMYKTLEGY